MNWHIVTTVLVHPKMKILSLITLRHVVLKPVRPSFIFEYKVTYF